MKKMLLISAVASAVAFAGGDIAPVQPVQPTAAPAACDFWGSLNVRYDAVKDASKNNTWGAKDNSFATAIVMGVEKKVGSLGGLDIGLGAEVAAWTILGMNHAASGSAVSSDKVDDGELSQLYLTAKYNNTAFKIGRQALPKSLSPWAWSDRSVGVIDNAFNGIVVVNTDLADTTLVGAWVHSYVKNNSNTRIAGNKGLYMLTAQYKGIANTTLTGSVYYIPKEGNTEKSYSAWASAETKVSNIDLGLQLAYAKLKGGAKATQGVAAYVGTSYEGLDAKLTLAYLQNGSKTLALGGTSAFWGNTGYSSINGKGAGADNGCGTKEKIVKLDLGYTLPNNYGKIYGGVAYDKMTGGTNRNKDKIVAARAGYSFNVMGVDAKVEYRYEKTTPVQGNAYKKQTVRVEGIYKF